MKKSTKITMACVLAFALGCSANNFAKSGVPANFKVAVVDVQKVVTGSSQVNALKVEQKKQLEELVSFAEKARAEVAKETNATKQKELEDKYNAELNLKKDAMKDNYTKKLTEIDNNITKVIQEKAKTNCYDLVLAKGVVLQGGVDITNEVAKAIK